VEGGVERVEVEEVKVVEEKMSERRSERVVEEERRDSMW
jgi:hypothetical protein